MIFNYPYLKDKTFLKEFDNLKIKEQYVKITVLTLDEKPIQSIEGRVVSGSINVDGASSIRRTGNLTIITDDIKTDYNQIEYLFSLNKKVAIETGFINTTDKYTKYDTIWFPLGIFVIISPSISNNNSGIQISLQLKDKMCLLNGECGGTIPASTVFHEYEVYDNNGNYVIDKPTIFRIIQELVNHFGEEPLSNIIISDVENIVKTVARWNGDTPLYVYEIVDELSGVQQFASMTWIENMTPRFTYEKGQDIGYIYTDFTYPGELIGKPGDTVCTILDQIKNTLGNYEYFYDVEGKFVFQEIKNYLNTTQAFEDVTTEESGNFISAENIFGREYNYAMDPGSGKSVYKFEDANLITAFSNSPQYNMIKNDFIVWGKRKTSEGYEFPIRFHLAIDSKPRIGNTYIVVKYTSQQTEDFSVANLYPNKNAFPSIGQIGLIYAYQEGDSYFAFYWNTILKDYVSIPAEDIHLITTTDWRTELYLSGKQGLGSGIRTNYYYTELVNEWPKLYDIINGEFYELENNLDYFLDFIDSGTVAQYNISNIGRRSKIIEDETINCLFEPEIINRVWLNSEDESFNKITKETCDIRSQPYLQVENSIYNQIIYGGTYNGAFVLIQDLLYQYTNYNESISITTLPIYYLEPNTRITVRDDESGISGDFIIKSLSVPLDATGTMTISCVKALTKI